ncbi:MAG: VCBS repeat-containing protein, partial [Planctomycetota bacterium]
MKSRTCSMTLILSLLSFGSGAEAGSEFPTFSDETDTRLSASPATGSADISEKDYGIGDFDQDGDDDVVVARRIGLNPNNGQPLPNTLLMNEAGVLTDRTAALAPGLLDSQRSRDVAVADVDGDGWLDVLVADGPNNPLVLLLNQGESAGVWQGFVASPASLPVGFNVDAWSIAVG